MKRCLLLALVPVFIFAQSVRVENLRTELYSKDAQNSLKKVELSLEFEGANLNANYNKLLDSTNTVISSFFYEDLFTELGKMRFKDTLAKFINKKYQLNVKNIYILSLKGIEKFDLKELKSFLKDSNDEREEVKKAIKEQNTSIQVPKIPPLPDINTILNDSNENINLDDLNIQNIQKLQVSQILNLPDNSQGIRLKDKNLTDSKAIK